MGYNGQRKNEENVNFSDYADCDGDKRSGV